MNLKFARNNTWLCTPIIGLLIVSIRPTINFLQTFSEGAIDINRTKYLITYKRGDGSTFSRVGNGAAWGHILVLTILFYLAFLLYLSAKETIIYLVNSPFLFLAPFYLTGLATIFTDDRIDKYINKQKNMGNGYATLLITITLAAIVPYTVPESMKILTEASSGWGEALLYIALCILMLVGIWIPLALSITLTIGFYKATYKVKGVKGVLLSKMNLVVIASMWLLNLPSVPFLFAYILDLSFNFGGMTANHSLRDIIISMIFMLWIGCHYLFYVGIATLLVKTALINKYLPVPKSGGFKYLLAAASIAYPIIIMYFFNTIGERAVNGIVDEFDLKKALVMFNEGIHGGISVYDGNHYGIMLLVIFTLINALIFAWLTQRANFIPQDRKKIIIIMCSAVSLLYATCAIQPVLMAEKQAERSLKLSR